MRAGPGGLASAQAFLAITENPAGEEIFLISVLMPAFNAAAHVAELIASILGQTHDTLELLVQDDGSSDATLAIVRAIAARDQRIRVLPPFASNRGLIEARNALLAAARGSFVAWQDADDISAPDRLARQLAFLEANQGLAGVGTGIVYVSEDGKALREETFSADPVRQATDPHLCCATLLVRADAAARAGPFRAAFGPGGEDGDWLLRITDHGLVTNIDDILYSYRQHHSASKRAVGAIRRLGVLARFAARSRRAGKGDPVDALVVDRRLDYLADDVFLALPGLTPDERLTALRYPLPDRQRLVTVLIPYFNADDYFRECLERLAAQSFRNFEVVIYDDGSTRPVDSNWAASLLADVPVRVDRGERNNGVVHARNALLARAKGSFIAWQDADDYSADDRLDRQVGHLLANPGLNAVGTAIHYLNVSVVSRTERYRSHAFQHGSFRGCCATFMIRTTAARAVGEFDRRLAGAAEDIDFLRRIEPQSSVGNIDEPLYYYRRHGDQQLTGRTEWGVAQAYYDLTRILHDHGLAVAGDPIADSAVHRAHIEAALRFRRVRLDGTDFAAMYVRVHLRDVRNGKRSAWSLVPLTLRFPMTMASSIRKFTRYRGGLLVRRLLGRPAPAPALAAGVPASVPSASPRALVARRATMARPASNPVNDAARADGLILVACWDGWGDFDDALRYLTPGGKGIWSRTAFVRDDGHGADWHAIFNEPGTTLDLEASSNRIIFAIGEPPTPNHWPLHSGQGNGTIVFTSDEAAAAMNAGKRQFVLAPCMARTWSVKRSYDELVSAPFEAKPKFCPG